MATSSAAQRKHRAKIAVRARAQRMLNAKKNGGPLIPTKVLHKLASLNLPPNPWVYDVCLRELLRNG